MSFKASGRRSGDVRLVVATKARLVHNATENVMVPNSRGRMKAEIYKRRDVQLKYTLR
jgi:hypothetical protein